MCRWPLVHQRRFLNYRVCLCVDSHELMGGPLLKQDDITSCMESVPVVGKINVCFTPVAEEPWSCMTSGGGKFLSRCCCIVFAICDVSDGRMTCDPVV